MLLIANALAGLFLGLVIAAIAGGIAQERRRGHRGRSSFRPPLRLRKHTALC